ncbi:hypothetical protein AJ78_05665 [Emergomyces pasteurianus Ep9510]|uniref:BZIP domain-containing protein n=1 Tax=Emergomyces pasteurianus Ep9510 TaxID=1447872 RepID=A0A1J9PBK5_9EURO|nr:hypothetical protein AJ78_05665 [Emergomyces pasteurianus Ep9510]
MFHNSESNIKSDTPLMLPIERSQREIRREKNRLAQRRHREAKRKSAKKTHSHDRVHKDQAEQNASTQERQNSQSPGHNTAAVMNSDFFEEMSCIPDALETGNLEERLIEELTDISSTWEPNFYQENATQNHPPYTTSETTNLPSHLFDPIVDNRSQLAMSDIHPWRCNSRTTPSPLRAAMPSLQSNQQLIQVTSVDKLHPPPPSEQQFSRQAASEPTSAANSQLPDLNRGLFHSEDIEIHEPFRKAMDGSNHLDSSFQPLSQELITTITDTSGRINNRRRNKRREAYGVGEERLEKILSVIEEEGYESMDALAAEYYTGQFPKDSLLASEQFHSRTRRLGRLLHQIHQSCKTWSKIETAGYRDIVIRTAEELFQEEVRSRRRKEQEVEMHRPDHPSPSPSSITSPWMPSHEDPEIPESGAVGSQEDSKSSACAAVRDLIQEKDLAPVLMQDVSRLQNTVCGWFQLPSSSKISDKRSLTRV